MSLEELIEPTYEEALATNTNIRHKTVFTVLCSQSMGRLHDNQVAIRECTRYHKTVNTYNKQKLQIAYHIKTYESSYCVNNLQNLKKKKNWLDLNLEPPILQPNVLPNMSP